MTTEEKYKAALEKIAALQPTAPEVPHDDEDFVPYDYWGGHADDTYWAGCDAGAAEGKYEASLIAQEALRVDG